MSSPRDARVCVAPPIMLRDGLGYAAWHSLSLSLSACLSTYHCNGNDMYMQACMYTAAKGYFDL